MYDLTLGSTPGQCIWLKHSAFFQTDPRGMSAFARVHRVGRGGSEAPYTNNFFLMISGSVWA